MRISLFKNSFADKPEEQLDIKEFHERTVNGFWQKPVLKLRSIKDLRAYKKTKESLPAVTMSGEFNTRDKHMPISQRLKKHSGYIALDIDFKDNPKMKASHLEDNECLMQYVSCSGKGKKIIYRCELTKDPAVHRRIYDAAVQRLEKKGVKLKVDPIVKNIASLQYVSYDPDAYYFPKSKLIIKPLPAIKIKKVAPSEDQTKDIEQLKEYLSHLEKDITEKYEDWLTIGMGLTYSLGEAGREIYHEISKKYKGYDRGECDEKYDALLERSPDSIERPVTLSSIFQLINDALPKAMRKKLGKKYNQSHAVGIGEDTEQGDLSGLVRYKLFLFKKQMDKESNKLAELMAHEINLNAFEALLKSKGFYRYENMFVQIVDNIVEKVDEHDILRIVTRQVESDGDYDFTYQKIEFHFSWEELVHLWRKIRGQATTFNQIATCLEHWQPNLLKDTMDTSYVPYKNGVLFVTRKERKLLPYSSVHAEIWKERILTRDFKYTQEIGMFEEFFGNVCGKGTTRKEITASERFKRSLWYFGYMLHGFKRQSMARAWMLYDIKVGNSGRTGKTIIGKAVAQIRNTVIIDGKQVNFKDNRFALQKVNAWTEVVFIDDPQKGMSIIPLFNMITGDSDAERKGKDPITKSLKYMIASNWIMEAEGTSEQGRQFVTQIDDFYVRYSKEHKNCLQPIVHLHGKDFFTEWNELDWNQFDSFCSRALQIYLGKESPENTIIGNSVQIRFIQMHEKELFFELSSAFALNVKKGKDGFLLIGQKVMVNLVKESIDYTGSTKSGKIVREFLACIGGGEIAITSVMIANMPQMAYKLNKKYEELDFGDIAQQLPKPKF